MKSRLLPVCSNPAGKEQKAEDRGQWSVVSRRKTVGGRRMADGRWQMADDGRQAD
jgi:hypothetical protein